MVALGTLDPYAEEDLAERSRGDFRRAERLVNRRRAVRRGAAFRGDDIAGELVVRPVLRELPAHPARHRDGTLRRHGVFVHLQNVRPFHRPEVRIFGAIQQRVDQLCALVRRGIGEERTRFGGGGQGADGIEENPSQEGIIVGDLTRRDAEPFEFIPDVLIGKVRFGWPWKLHARPRQRDATHGDVAHVAHENRRLAGFVARRD